MPPYKSEQLALDAVIDLQISQWIEEKHAHDFEVLDGDQLELYEKQQDFYEDTTSNFE